MTINPKTFAYALAPNGVATITLNRPDRLNSLTFEVYAIYAWEQNASDTGHALLVLVSQQVNAIGCESGHRSPCLRGKFESQRTCSKRQNRHSLG